MSLQSITLLLLFVTFAKVKSKEIRISKNSFENHEIDVSRGKSEKSMILKKLYRDDNTTHGSSSNRRKITRSKRQSQDPWIVKDFEDFQNLINFHALVVRDENIPPCGMTANVSTNSRYFMCSGAILTERHAITTASCIHFAHIYEHHIDGDMAVLVGATTDKNQVIRIARIEMHPSYDYDVESANYAVYNLAILHLECPICPGLAYIPKLPRNPYQDLGHLCCSDRCKILTVVQCSNNRHKVRLLSAKHLPSAEHTAEESNEERKNELAESMQNKRKRLIRSPGKLAAAPVFFEWEKTKLNLTDENLEFSNPKRNRNAHEDGRKSESKIDPPNVSDKNTEVLEDFIKKLVNTMIARIENALRPDNNPKDLPMGKTMDTCTNLTESATSGNLTEALMDNLVSVALDKIGVTDEPMYSETERNILEAYVECPPLGTPVIRDDILVGMVAYTCDDVQDWVPWKYVEISKNMNWIMDRLQTGSGEWTKNYLNQKRHSRSNRSFSTTCSGPVGSMSNSPLPPEVAVRAEDETKRL